MNNIKRRAFQVGQAEMLEQMEVVIRARLRYCQEQNGLSYCKNCGLCEEDLLELKEE